MVIRVCVNIVVIRVIGVKYQIIKRWVCPMGTQLFLFGHLVIRVSLRTANYSDTITPKNSIKTTPTN